VSHRIILWELVRIVWHKTASPPHTDGSVVFARLCQCAPPSNRVPWTHLTQHPKLHLNRFSHFCRAHGRESPYFTMGRSLFHLKISPWTRYLSPHLIHSFLSPPKSTPERHLDRFNCFCRAHDRDRPLWCGYKVQLQTFTDHNVACLHFSLLVPVLLLYVLFDVTSILRVGPVWW